MRRAWALLFCLAGATAHASPPQVEIRAQTRLALERMRLLSADRAELHGQLLDSLTGDGIGGQVVAIAVGDRTTTARTDPDGRFTATIDVDEGAQPVELRFGGTSHMTSASLSQVTDPARSQVSLTMDLEEVPGGARLVVRATADDQPIAVRVALSAGPVVGELRAIGETQTGAPFQLTRKAAGGAGPRRVRARFEGDDARQAASAERTIDLSAGSTTTMAVSANRIAYEDDLGVSGKVTDEDGEAVARAVVTLSSGDRRLAQAPTAEDGSYRFRIEGEVLGEGQWGLQVQADPRGNTSVKPSRSAPEIVRVLAPQPVPVSYTIAAFVATALAAGGFFTARARPWQRLRRPTPPADAVDPTPAEELAEGGLVAARPGLVSTLRRPSDDGFSGVVRDTVRGRPVADAGLVLRAAGAATSSAPREATTEPDGAFELEALPAGDWHVAVTAPGHVTETFVITIPHRGELRGVRIDLVPVRERVFQLYRRAAEPILPEPRLWGVWSPRQIVDHVRSRRPTPALAALTSFVEEVYFSPRLADEEVLPTASDHVDQAIRERARGAS